jgi:IS30 family transposase
LDKFNHLEELWGLKNFRKVFPVILTDNGSEFKDPKSLEFSPKGKRRTKIFYCDPNTSWQKPGVEKSHVEIRKILPKGSSFEKLTQTQTFMVRDHVNSLSRENLNGRCAFELASLLLPDEVISTLALKRIPPDEVILKPLLLKK